MANNLAFESQFDSDYLSQIDLDIQEVDHVSAHNLSDDEERPIHKSHYIIILVLFIINLLNYIDRFTIAGILDEIKHYYKLDDKQAGLLQTCFILTYMIMSPIFGYLGDRISRKKLILCGVTFWSIITLSSSFIPQHLFPLFVVMRSLVGVGEASYSTVAPTIISDLFTGDRRTKVMAFFYFAVPVGSGLGFIIGFGLFRAFHQWQYALRLSPIIGIVCVILLFFFVREPERGSAEGGTHLAPSPWAEDIRQLTKNHSFLLISLGFTCVSFVIGSLTWWCVIYLNYSIDAYFKKDGSFKAQNISIVFGVMTMIAGIIGVAIGTESGRRLRKRWPSSDPIVCAFGLIAAAPFIVVALVLAKFHLNWSLAMVFVAQTFLCLNWALVTDMTMGVVIPTRRATATAYQMILSHAFGDAGSPYIIGAISDKLRSQLGQTLDSFDATYLGLQYALYINPFISVLGGVLFLCCSIYIVQGKHTVLKLIAESKFHFDTVGSRYEPEDSRIFSEATTPPSEDSMNLHSSSLLT